MVSRVICDCICRSKKWRSSSPASAPVDTWMCKQTILPASAPIPILPTSAPLPDPFYMQMDPMGYTDPIFDLFKRPSPTVMPSFLLSDSDADGSGSDDDDADSNCTDLYASPVCAFCSIACTVSTYYANDNVYCSLYCRGKSMSCYQ